MERGPIVYLIAVGVVMRICAALFRPAEDTFLPQAVPADQLSAAVALNAARGSVTQLSGTAAGGFLFAVARFVPFLAYAVAHAVRTSSSSCWPKVGEYARGRSARAVRCQSGQSGHGEIAVERRLRLVAGDAALQGGLVRLDDSRQRVDSEWILPTPFPEGVR